VRGAAAVAVSSLPAFFSSVFSDVNPGIIESIWWLTFIAIAAGAVCYVIFRSISSKRGLIALGGLLLAGCLVWVELLLAIALDVLSFNPAMNAWLTRFSFISFLPA
jgi:hypothetical protein